MSLRGFDNVTVNAILFPFCLSFPDLRFVESIFALKIVFKQARMQWFSSIEGRLERLYSCVVLVDH